MDAKQAEQTVAARPGDVAAHRALAEAHRHLLAGDAPEDALVAIVRDLPGAFTSLLHLGRVRELRGDRRGAVLTYLRAIKTARARGFWHDPSSTPEWLRGAVQHAMRVAHDGRRAIFHEWLEPWVARHGADEMARVADGLAMWLGTRPLVIADPRHRPSFFYLPGVPVTPVFPRDTLPFADAYEAETETIRAELARVLADGAGITKFHYDRPSDDQGWDAYFFFREGVRFDDHHAACPETSRVLASLPLDHVRDHGPEWCFSLMRPGAHILPHRGVTNTRAVLHLGLEIPPDCALHLVGVQEVTWERGRCFAFDDTFEHEAWNRSGETRAVLLGDIWNPHLRAPEREALAELIALIGDVNRATAPAPAHP